MEITRRNFHEQFDNINRDIKEAAFIGFDAEFTALLTGERFRHRLFDTNEQRYDLMKYDIDKMMITQVGLTTFRYERKQDSFVATGYTFHLCPQNFGDIDQSFIFQASTLKFLCQHQFNFNKFIYEGIHYLSKAEEVNLRTQLDEKVFTDNVARNLSMKDEKLLQSYCSDVSKWLINSDEDTLYLELNDPVLRYIVHNEIRFRFPDVYTTNSLGDGHKVLIYRNKDVHGAHNIPLSVLEENLINHLLGFSQVINLLAGHRKPIVGHNIFLDTLLLHNQFIGPLPQEYQAFKKNINKYFPVLFDTKFISHEMSKKLSFDEVWKSNALQDLYEFFSEGKCKKLEQGINLIKLSSPFSVKQTYHEAGWDSFCSGYCFVRLGHWAASECAGGKPRPMTPAQIVAALQQYCNKVNVIRGAVPYMNLVDDDPPSHRPDLLYIKSLREPTINVSKVAASLAALGSVDVKPVGARAALVAAYNQHTVDKILTQFRDSRDYKICTYNVFRHSTATRVAIWSGALFTGSLVLLLIHKKMNS